MGSHEGGFTPFELDITDSVKIGGENDVFVLVDARSMATEIILRSPIGRSATRATIPAGCSLQRFTR
jgi:hypothetical protein